MAAMECFRTKKELTEYIQGFDSQGADLALAPTMGSLHPGHESLFQKAKEFGRCAVSIFVNPLQFNETSDYKNYPQDIEADLAICKKNGVDIVFMPTVEEMYSEKKPLLEMGIPLLSSHLCGASRPGHFEGVLLVVIRLLHLFQPNWAIFGKKDYQQYIIIRQMVQDIDLPVQIIGSETIREENGLAYSSRNHRLSPSGQEQASLIYRALKIGEKAWRDGEKDVEELREIIKDVVLSGSSNSIDYLEFVDMDSLQILQQLPTDQNFLIAIAVFCEDIRLIDNLECST